MIIFFFGFFPIWIYCIGVGRLHKFPVVSLYVLFIPAHTHYELPSLDGVLYDIDAVAAIVTGEWCVPKV